LDSYNSAHPVKTSVRLSLRAKITLALLFTGLTSAVLVGVIARSLVMQQFSDAVFESSFSAFHGDMTAYLEAYGTSPDAWTEPFPEFAARRRLTVPGPSREGVSSLTRRSATPTDPEDVPLPGAGGPGPGPDAAASFVPPFFFVVVDPNRRVLRGPATTFPAGSTVSANLVASGRPIVVNNQTVAFAIPVGEPNLTDLDLTYLDAMRNGVLWGIAGAGILALALGFFFSGRLSANLRALAQAIEAVSSGDLRQHVRVRSHDEVGFLGESFNKMSQELAASHDTIREQAARMREMATTDELTQLHNRRFFDERAAIAYAQAQRYRRPFAVAIGDIDHFKKINDTYSHAMGDSVLRQVARILSAGTRETDVVARYGGEEFVIAFAETPLRDAAATCERIRRTIEEYPWQEVHPDLRVTMTIGVDGDMARGNVRRMVEAADELLYTGKQTGRNRVCFEGEPAPA
jgi:diguanylate cyclase (GGDEF)-like protein